MCAIQITFLNRVYRESRSVEEMKKKIQWKGRRKVVTIWTNKEEKACCAQFFIFSRTRKKDSNGPQLN